MFDTFSHKVNVASIYLSLIDILFILKSVFTIGEICQSKVLQGASTCLPHLQCMICGVFGGGHNPYHTF